MKVHCNAEATGVGVEVNDRESVTGEPAEAVADDSWNEVCPKARKTSDNETNREPGEHVESSSAAQWYFLVGKNGTN